jgi:hypothetical protein
MNMPNLASVHHFIRRAFWASVSLGSWAIEIWQTVSKTIAAIKARLNLKNGISPLLIQVY